MMAGIDIHKRVLQSAVLEPAAGEFVEERFSGREGLADWAMRWRGRVGTVAIEATTGWRWVARELIAAGFEVHLVDPGQAKALRGKKRKAKTDRLDARWLCLLIARGLLAEAEAWLAPAEIQELRDRTRLRKALADDRSRWAQRLHALLTQEGWPCERARLLTVSGRRWVQGLALPAASRTHAELLLRLIEQLEAEIETLEAELRRFAKADPRCQRLTRIFGVGPIIACHLLAEIGEASRFRRARQVVRLAGLDPVVAESAEHKRRGKLAKAGPPALRWALVQAAQHAGRENSPEHALYAQAAARCGTQRAKLTVARKIAHRAYHLLSELEREQQLERQQEPQAA
jgi:transposase